MFRARQVEMCFLLPHSNSVLLAFDQCQGLITSSDHNYDESWMLDLGFWYVHTYVPVRPLCPAPSISNSLGQNVINKKLNK